LGERKEEEEEEGGREGPAEAKPHATKEALIKG
jgi:hypothetical protein